MSKRSRMQTVAGVVALVGLVASLVVHVSTFFADVTISTSWAVPLSVGIFPLFLGVIATLQERTGRDPRRIMAAYFAGMPDWAPVALVLSFIYTFVNFALFAVRTYPHRAADSMAARGVSGHWIFFYVLTTLFFLVRREPEGEPKGE